MKEILEIMTTTPQLSFAVGLLIPISIIVILRREIVEFIKRRNNFLTEEEIITLLMRHMDSGTAYRLSKSLFDKLDQTPFKSPFLEDMLADLRNVKRTGVPIHPNPPAPPQKNKR